MIEKFNEPKQKRNIIFGKISTLRNMGNSVIATIIMWTRSMYQSIGLIHSSDIILNGEKMCFRQLFSYLTIS